MSGGYRQSSGKVLVLAAVSCLGAWSPLSATETWLASWGFGPGVASNGQSDPGAVSADGR